MVIDNSVSSFGSSLTSANEIKIILSGGEEEGTTDALFDGEKFKLGDNRMVCDGINDAIKDCDGVIDGSEEIEEDKEGVRVEVIDSDGLCEFDGDLVAVRLFVAVRVTDRLAVSDRLVDGLALIDFDGEVDGVLEIVSVEVEV